MKNKKYALFLSAAGVIGLASFGIANTAGAFNDLSRGAQPVITQTVVPADSSASGCSLYGCAACPVCTQVLYQPPAVVVPAEVAQY